MNYLSAPGRLLYPIAVLAFGVLHFVFGHTLMGMLPLPAWLPAPLFWTYLDGTIFTLTGITMLVRVKSLPESFIAGTWFLFLYLLLNLRGQITTPHDPAVWTGAFELVALGGGAFLWGGRSWGKYLYAASLVIFAIQHFLYAEFIAGLIPGWIPFHLFWAYFVGVVFLASVVSIVLNAQVRLSGTLLGILFFLWVLILHGPRVVASPHKETEWTSLFVALAMGAIAWILTAQPGKPADR